MTEAPNKCSAHSRCSAWDVLIGALYQGSEGPGRHPGTTPPVPLGALAQELCMSLCLLRAPRPRDSPVLSLVSDYPTLPHRQPLTPLSLSLLPVHSRGRPMCLRVHCEIPDRSGGAAAGPDEETYPSQRPLRVQGGLWGEERQPCVMGVG